MTRDSVVNLKITPEVYMRTLDVIQHTPRPFNSMRACIILIIKPDYHILAHIYRTHIQLFQRLHKEFRLELEVFVIAPNYIPRSLFEQFYSTSLECIQKSTVIQYIHTPDLNICLSHLYNQVCGSADYFGHLYMLHVQQLFSPTFIRHFIFDNEQLVFLGQKPGRTPKNRSKVCMELVSIPSKTVLLLDMFPCTENALDTISVGYAFFDEMIRLRMQTTYNREQEALRCVPAEKIFVLQFQKQTRYIQECRCHQVHNTPEEDTPPPETYYIDDKKEDICIKRDEYSVPSIRHRMNYLTLDEKWYRKAYHIPENEQCRPHYYREGIHTNHISTICQIQKYYPHVSYTLEPTFSIQLGRQTYPSVHTFVNDNMKLCQLYQRSNLTEEYTSSDTQTQTQTQTPPPPVKQRKCMVLITSTNDAICLRILYNLDSLLMRNCVDVCLCYLKAIVHPLSSAYLKRLSRTNVNVRIITHQPDLGSDIIPFYFVFRHLFRHTEQADSKDDHAHEWILKVHTKSDPVWRNNALNKLVLFMETPDWDTRLTGHCGASAMVQSADNFNEHLIQELFDMQLTPAHTFSAGTFFIMRRDALQRMFDDANVKRLLQASAICGCYYDNIQVFENSPMHSLERLFGYLPAQQNQPLKQIEYPDPEQVPPTDRVHILILTATYANSRLKQRALRNNHTLLLESNSKNYAMDFVYINSEECDPLDASICIPEEYSARNTCTHLYVKNDMTLIDTGKWVYGIEQRYNKQTHTHVLLINDSIILLRPIVDFFDFMVKQTALTGIVSSTEVRLHVPSFLRCVPATLVDPYLEYVAEHKASVHSVTTNILELEVGMCDVLTPVWLYDSPPNENIHFHSERVTHYVYALQYPILKIKWVLRYMEHINNIHTTFNATIYRELNPDLAHVHTDNLLSHYIHIGANTNRPYLHNVLKQVGKEPIRKILRDHNILKVFDA